MKGGLRGALAAALGLSLMQLVLSTSTDPKSPAAGRLAQLFQVPGALARAFVDPTTPAIPDLSGTPATIASSNGPAGPVLNI